MHCAIDVEYRAGNVACRGGYKEGQGACNFFGFSDTFHWKRYVTERLTLGHRCSATGAGATALTRMLEAPRLDTQRTKLWIPPSFAIT